MSADHLRNDGIVIRGGAAEPGGPSTIVAVGVPRSGTSMVGAALHSLGIPLGDDLDMAVLEDRAIAKAIEIPDLEDFTKLAAGYDARFPIWGFKRPKAFTRLPEIVARLRNPRVVAVMRDPVAIAMRNQISAYHDISESLVTAAKANSFLLRQMNAVSCPAMMVSYEKALLSPRRFCAALAEFVGLRDVEAKLDAAAAAVVNGAEIYLKSARVEFDGEYRISPEGDVSGWFMSNGPRPTLEVLANSAVVSELAFGERIAQPAGAPQPDSPIRDVTYWSFAGKLPPEQSRAGCAVRAKGTAFLLRQAGAA